MISEWEVRTGNRVAFVLQTGDFEPHRDESDIPAMPATGESTVVGDFPDFREEWAALPWPVHFIGGDREPYGFLDTMPDGGEIAPNCFYMGRVGCVELEGCCVVGVSGIFGEDHFYHERPAATGATPGPNSDTIYFNESDIGRALDYASSDILILHEWPAGIIDAAHAGEIEDKRHELGYQRTGSEYARMLLDLLEPKLLLCGRMQTSYRTRVELPSGDFAQVCCLANIEHGAGAVAFFQIMDNGEVREEI